MRLSIVATLLLFVALPLASVSAQQPYAYQPVASGCNCGCGAPVPAPMPVVAPCNTGACGLSGGCDACSTCGRGLCANPALFYEMLYAEFYARNPWYLEHKARESAARRARLHGQDPDAAVPPQNSPGPIKAPANKVAEPIKTT